MKILFVDNDKELESLFSHLSSVGDYETILGHSYEECIKEYKNNEFYIIIINFSLEFGKKFLEYILHDKPKQRIITISGKLDSSDNKGGEHCQLHYNKRRLLKPLNPSELIKVINNFDNTKCEFRNKFHTKSGLIEIMDKVVDQYTLLTYDETMHRVHFKHFDSQVLQFLDNLKDCNIDFTLDDTYIQLKI